MQKPEDVTVLIVDDEEDVREYLTSVLEDAGLNVVTAESGTRALEMVAATPPDLISTDLVMPGKSGIRLIHELRRNAEWAKIPVLIVTGHARDTDIKIGLDDILSEASLVGPSACLEKPVTPRSYLDSVCRILEVVPNADSDLPPTTEGMRREAEDLLQNADQATIARILAELQKGE